MSAVFFFCWLKSYNSDEFPRKIILISLNFHGNQLPWVPWIFWLKLLSSLVGQFSWHLAAVCAVVFFADWSLITVPYYREKAYFSNIVFTAYSCREFCEFFVYNYWPVGWANSHGSLLPWVPWFIFADLSLITLPYCLEKAYFSQLIFTAPSCGKCRGFFG